MKIQSQIRGKIIKRILIFSIFLFLTFCSGSINKLDIADQVLRVETGINKFIAYDDFAQSTAGPI